MASAREEAVGLSENAVAPPTPTGGHRPGTGGLDAEADAGAPRAATKSWWWGSAAQGAVRATARRCPPGERDAWTARPCAGPDATREQSCGAPRVGPFLRRASLRAWLTSSPAPQPERSWPGAGTAWGGRAIACQGLRRCWGAPGPRRPSGSRWRWEVPAPTQCWRRGSARRRRAHCSFQTTRRCVSGRCAKTTARVSPRLTPRGCPRPRRARGGTPPRWRCREVSPPPCWTMHAAARREKPCRRCGTNARRALPHRWPGPMPCRGTRGPMRRGGSAATAWRLAAARAVTWRQCFHTHARWCSRAAARGATMTRKRERIRCVPRRVWPTTRRSASHGWLRAHGGSTSRETPIGWHPTARWAQPLATCTRPGNR